MPARKSKIGELHLPVSPEQQVGWLQVCVKVIRACLGKGERPVMMTGLTSYLGAGRSADGNILSLEAAFACMTSRGVLVEGWSCHG